MRTFCTTGLILCASLGWAASRAHAQSGSAAPSLLPLPTVAPVETTSIAASYSVKSAPTETYGSAFLIKQEPVTDSAEKAKSAPTPFEESLQDTCWGDEDCCGQGGCGVFFGALGGLVMTRNRANPYWTTYETNNNANQLLNTQSAGAGWDGGGQVTIGYGFAGLGAGSCDSCASQCGGCNYLGPGIAFTYWGVAPMRGSASVRDINNELSTPINLDTQTGPVLIGAQPAADFFDNARAHRITRDDRVTNLELNLLQGGWTVGRLQMVALLGFRYFRFDERLSWGAAAGGTEFGQNGGTTEAFLNFRCVNNLYGAQVGSLFNFNVTDRFALFLVPEAGIYGNQMNVRAHLFRGDGVEGFDILAHKSDVSFLGQIDTGLSYAFTDNLRGFIGYRVVGVANVALADNQFLPYLADTQGFGQVKQSGSLILHGALIGVGWVF
jgi:hypothetical protein